MVNGRKIGWYISIALIAVVFIMGFFIIKPIALSIAGGFLLAYIFYPLYKKTLSLVKEKNISSLIICFLLLVIIAVPAWFLMPMLARQMFEIYLFLQKADFAASIMNLFSGDFSPDFYALINNFVNKIATSLLNESTSFILNFQTILLHAAVIFFVLFFSLRDGEQLCDYVKSLSPLSPETEELFFKKFKDVTNSVLFGQIIVGLIQGITAGFGYLIFGVSNTLSLTIITIFFGMIPVVGPAIVWVPVDIFLLVQGKTGSAIGLFIYGILIVSTIDNIVRPLIVSQKTKTNSGIILIGMIGGLFVFGVLGLIIGPLILAYSLLILDFYRNKKL